MITGYQARTVIVSEKQGNTFNIGLVDTQSGEAVSGGS